MIDNIGGENQWVDKYKIVSNVMITIALFEKTPRK